MLFKSNIPYGISYFQIKAKNQLRVNGLSFSMYFLTYFIVLVGLMSFICLCILGIIFLFDVPSLQEVPALITLAGLFMLYCPSSILFSTCLSYIFDKMDSAQSILPNIATFIGLIPFILVTILDMLGLSKLHIQFNTSKTKLFRYRSQFLLRLLCINEYENNEIHLFKYHNLLPRIN